MLIASFFSEVQMYSFYWYEAYKRLELPPVSPLKPRHLLRERPKHLPSSCPFPPWPRPRGRSHPAPSCSMAIFASLMKASLSLSLSFAMSLTRAPAALTEAHRVHNPYFRMIVSIRGTIRQRAVMEVNLWPRKQAIYILPSPIPMTGFDVTSRQA